MYSNCLVMVRHHHERAPHPVSVTRVIEMANDVLATQIMRDYYRKYGVPLPDDWTLPIDLEFTEFFDAQQFLNDEGDVEVLDPGKYSVEQWLATRDVELEHAQRVYDDYPEDA